MTFSSAYQAVYPKKLFLLAALVWTVVVILSSWLNVTSEREQSIHQATDMGRAYFNKDLSFRLWATEHGGVYVPISEHTPPNPYLAKIPERDITTPSGRKLTLMNPAYMLREVMTDFNKLFGVKGHITSLKPLNPDNAPDQWEKKALASFKVEEDEVTEVSYIGDDPYLRFMKPLVTKKGCLKCHGEQGYRVGDIRGGVSLGIPLAPFYRHAAKDIKIHIYTHFLFWVAGLMGLYFFWRALVKFLAERTAGEEEREKLIAGIRQSADAVIITDPEGRITFVNPAFESMTGFTKEEAFGKTPRILKSGEHGAVFYADLWNTVSGGRIWKGSFTNKRKNGSLFHDETTISPTFDEKGRIVGFVAVKRDVSREVDLQKARDFFTAVTSHELRTPLSKIKLLLLLLARREGESAKQMIEVTESLYDDLDWMMRQTGAISDISLSWRQRKYEPFYIFLAIDDCVRRAREEIVRHHRMVTVRVAVEESCRETMAHGSERMITAALDNLLSNGVKYTPDGGTVHIDCRMVDGKIAITVRDEGGGINEKDVADLAVPYFSNEDIDHHSTGSFRYKGGGVRAWPYHRENGDGVSWGGAYHQGDGGGERDDGLFVVPGLSLRSRNDG